MADTASAPQTSATVLVVEDDTMVRQVIRFILARDGHTVLEAADGRTALAVAGRHRGPIHLLIADVNLPSAKGPEVWRRLAADRPGLPALYISGDRSALDGRGGSPADDQAFLRKPFSSDALTGKVRELLGRPAPRPGAYPGQPPVPAGDPCPLPG